MNDSAPAHKSGYVAVVGRPNVGKSTLINAFLKQKVAAVSPRPQTTRRRQLGILTTEDAQVIFVDTPGLHQPVHKLGEYMNQVAVDALVDADVILWMVEANAKPTAEDQMVAVRFEELGTHGPLNVVLALNKIDLVPEDERALLVRRNADPHAQTIAVSARTGEGVPDLLDRLRQVLFAGYKVYYIRVPREAREVADSLAHRTLILRRRESEGFVEFKVMAEPAGIVNVLPYLDQGAEPW